MIFNIEEPTVSICRFHKVYLISVFRRTQEYFTNTTSVNMITQGESHDHPQVCEDFLTYIVGKKASELITVAMVRGSCWRINQLHGPLRSLSMY